MRNLCSVDASQGIIFVNNQLDAQFFFMYVYFQSLHVSGSHVPIIRRIICINMTSGMCRCVQMTVWCAGLDESHANLHTKLSSIQSDIYQMIDTINSPDDGHMAARNMQRIEINIHEKGIVHQVGYLQRVMRRNYCNFNSIFK